MSQITVDQAIRQVLEQFPAIKLAILFGSLAANRENAQSDLDLAVLAEKPLQDMGFKQALIAALGGAIGRPVDLVDMTTAGEPLLGEVFKGRRILGDSTLYAQALSRHLIDAADFLPYRQRILKERREQWITS